MVAGWSLLAQAVSKRGEVCNFAGTVSDISKPYTEVE